MLEEMLKSPDKIRRNSKVGLFIKAKMKEQQEFVSSANNSEIANSSFEKNL